MRDDTQVIKIGVKKINDQMEFFENQPEETQNALNIHFYRRMKSFAEQARKKLSIIESEVEKVFQLYQVNGYHYFGLKLFYCRKYVHNMVKILKHTNGKSFSNC